MSSHTHKIKEFFNLNGYYLRLSLTSQQLALVSYNSLLLNGIKYESKINLEEIKRNDKIKNLTVIGLYDLISKKIGEKKFLLQGEQNCLTLSLLENMTFNASSDIQLTLIKNNKSFTTEYENVLSNVIMNLKEENRNIKNEINEIKNILMNMNGGINIFPSEKDSHAGVKALGNPSIIINNNSNILNANQNNLKNSLPNQKLNNILPNSLNNQIAGQFKSAFSMPIPNQEQNQIRNSQGQIINKNISPNIINQPQINQIINKNGLNPISELNISSLANIEYGRYPPVELSPNSFNKISGYGANSYNGIARNYNEDRIKVILDYKLRKTIHSANGNIIYPNISYFGIYDGHGGNKCSNFLQEKLHTLLFESEYFPLYTLQAIYESYLKAEQEFQAMAFDSQKNILLDKSGSCSISILIIDEWCFVTYLGDSRALYSFDSGNQLFQITRDHKPQDPTERARIEKSGGRIYKDTRLKVNGQKIHVKEESMPGFNFPYRVFPGNLSVSLIFKTFYRLLELLEILVLKFL